MADSNVTSDGQEVVQARWIDLNDSSGARLKLASIDVGGQSVRHLFITNLAWSNPKWQRCVQEMGFKEAPSRRYLVRRVGDAERVSLRYFSGVFQRAQVREMAPAEYILGYGKAAESKADSRQARIDLQGAKRLGRNAQGHVIYEGVSGRFLLDEDSGRRIIETSASERSDYLRLPLLPQHWKPGSMALHEALTPIAKGLIKGMQQGEPMRSEHVRALLEAVFSQNDLGEQGHAAFEASLFDAMHESLLAEMRQAHEQAGAAYLEAARIHGYQPILTGSRAQSAMVPLPLALAAQQLLGNVQDQVVVMPNRWDGALAAFLSGAQVRAWQVQPYSGARREVGRTVLDDLGLGNLLLQTKGYLPLECAAADALLLNADPLTDEYGQREDLRLAAQSLRHLKHGGRAVLLLRGDDAQHPGRITELSSGFLQEIMQRYVVLDAWEAAPVLLRKNGDGPGVRLLLLKAEAPDAEQAEKQAAVFNSRHLPVMASWDAIKTHVDERIQTLHIAAPVDAAPKDKKDEQGDYQRPYLAFSRLGEARTMAPANLQAPMQQYLTSLESRVGPVDDFVSEQIGMGKASLMKRLSPEQIDGLAIMLSRLLMGRSSILADDTGIGKGRQLAALAVWANKTGKDVIFVTDRANLFSDLARDLSDIGEWGRFSPLVFNGDGEITIDAGLDKPPQVLAKGEPAESLRRIIEGNLSPREAGRNICFLTYSQINTEESEKARWLKNHAKDALVIFDEAHICAGSDSNMAAHASEIASSAAAVQFASATWAKTPDNLHVYQRAFPATVSASTLAETVRKGGETFSEIFSGMLGLEGALIRREHDLSRLEVELLVDERNRQRNERVSDLVADALGSSAYLAGEMEQVFIRTNADSVKALRQARDARSAALPSRVKLFSSNFGAGSVVYQVMKGVQGSLNAEHVSRLAIESLQRGMKPVIVSDATGESLLEKLMLEQIQAEAVNPQGEAFAASLVRIPTLRDLLRDVLIKRLTTVRVREMDAEQLLAQEAPDPAQAAEADGDPNHEDADEGAQANAVARPAARTPVAPRAADGDSDEGEGEQIEVTDALSAAHLSAGAQRAVRKVKWRELSIFDTDAMTADLKDVYERGIAEIERKIEAVPDIPVNAMDVIEQAIRDAGYRIGEITGRKHYLTKPDEATSQESQESWLLRPRATNKRAVKASIKAFNDGSLDALLINRSAAAGVSLHASPRFADRSRRHLIEHMIPEDPVNRVQLLGRVNRYDQVSSPLITTASTGIYGEVRYLMMQNRKLALMSANVRSSRDNAMSLKGVVDLFNSVGSRAVRSYMQDNPLVCKRLGFDSEEIERLPDVVNRVTMRIPLLTVVQQKQVYEEIYSRFDEILLREEMDGSHPLRPAEINVRARLQSQSLFMGDDEHEMDEQTALFASAFDSPVWSQRLAWDETLKPLSWLGVRSAAEARRAQMLKDGLIVVDEEEGRVNSDGEEFLLIPDQEEREDEAEVAAMVAAQIALFRADRTQDWRDTRVSRAKSDLFMPRLNGEIVGAVSRGFEGLRRLMKLQPGGDQAAGQDAQANQQVNSEAHKRSMLVHAWMDRNLSRLVPGASIAWMSKTEGDANSHRPDYIITDVQVPPREHWMNLGKWHITMAARGNEKGRRFTLRSLLSEVDGVFFRGGITGEVQTTLFGPTLREGIYGAPARRLADEFDTAPSGKRVRHATMLTGNLYLASEWAAATGKGRAVVYTDEAGTRHRGILLPQDMESIRPDLLPVRVADGATQRRLLHAILDPRFTSWLSGEQEERLLGQSFHVLDLSFKSAMTRMRGSGLPDAQNSIILVPGVGVGISMSATDLRRVAGGLKAAQKTMQQKTAVADDDDPSAVRIIQFRGRKGLPRAFSGALASAFSTQTRTDAALGGPDSARSVRGGLLLLKAETPEQVDRALHLLSEHAGLEIYAAQQPYRSMAQEAIRRTMRERRQQLAQAQVALLSGRSENPSQALPQDNAANTEDNSDQGISHPDPDTSSDEAGPPLQSMA